MYLTGRKPDVIASTQLAISIFGHTKDVVKFYGPSFHQQHEPNNSHCVESWNGLCQLIASNT